MAKSQRIEQRGAEAGGQSAQEVNVSNPSTKGSGLMSIDRLHCGQDAQAPHALSRHYKIERPAR
jgi:hypothetical protein